MAQDNSFTDKERAQWLKERRQGGQRDSNVSRDLQVDTCIHCGAPIRDGLPAGAEGGLCSACE